MMEILNTILILLVLVSTYVHYRVTLKIAKEVKIEIPKMEKILRKKIITKKPKSVIISKKTRGDRKKLEELKKSPDIAKLDDLSKLSHGRSKRG